MIELFFLGTGGTYPRKTRNTMCIVARIRGDVIVFDCGEGCQKDFIPRFGVNKATIILISHIHGDHVLGLPGLLLSFNLLGRKKNLTVIGPLGIQRYLAGLMKSLKIRLCYPLEVLEVGRFEGLREVYSSKNYSIFAWHVRHTAPTLGYILHEKRPRGKFNVDKAKELKIPRGRLWKKLQLGLTVRHRDNIYYPEDVLDNMSSGVRVVYSGDTLPDLNLMKYAAHADVLIHDASFLLRDFSKALESAHSTVFNVAEIAANIGVKNLVLVHITPRYDSKVDRLSEEASQIFNGNVFIPEDGEELRVK
ncbi:MAG: ribonuclease Z [Thermoprotei archaeon]|nr:MAG: ribonuclease Z [Thermoprotei archaeon]RLF02779.1 MAG: ribonuclease Z [Thermoprotei archaeon]